MLNTKKNFNYIYIKGGVEDHEGASQSRDH